MRTLIASSTLALIALALVALAGCAAPGARAPSHLETVDETGFTITEEVRLDGSVRADYDRAVTMLAAGDFPGGIALLETVTQAAPNVTAPHINLGIAYSRSDRLANAEVSLKRALELNPRHPIAHNELGMVYRRTGQIALARSSYEQALAIHPEFHFARRNLAILCDIYLKDLACALDNYERYLAAVPDDAEAAMWIADLKNRVSQEPKP
jgi:Flp pilus assembly protein TadD